MPETIDSHSPRHPSVSRRFALQAGAVGLLGLGTDHLAALRSAVASDDLARAVPAGRSVIFIFLSGGLAQHDSFDPKPDAPEGIRGEFRPIATRTPGVHVCEYLPLLAAMSHRWSMVRSLTHATNDHSAGHHIMLTGRSDLPPGFNPNQPKPTDWPSIAAVAGATSGWSTTRGGSSPASSPGRWGRVAIPGSSRRLPSTRPPTGPIPSTNSTIKIV